MDDIIKLCDELESCKRKNICYKNEIVCTRALVNRYIDCFSNVALGDGS